MARQGRTAAFMCMAWLLAAAASWHSAEAARVQHSVLLSRSYAGEEPAASEVQATPRFSATAQAITGLCALLIAGAICLGRFRRSSSPLAAPVPTIPPQKQRQPELPLPPGVTPQDMAVVGYTAVFVFAPAPAVEQKQKQLQELSTEVLPPPAGEPQRMRPQRYHLRRNMTFDGSPTLHEQAMYHVQSESGAMGQMVVYNRGDGGDALAQPRRIRPQRSLARSSTHDLSTALQEQAMHHVQSDSGVDRFLISALHDALRAAPGQAGRLRPQRSLHRTVTCPAELPGQVPS